MFAADEALFRTINGWAGHWPALDKAMLLVATDYFIPVSLALFLLGLWFSGRSPQRQANQKAVLLATLSLGMVNLLLKLFNLIYYRPRPFTQMEVNLLFYRPHDSSFPSNLTAVAFGVAATVWFYNRRVGRWLFIPAGLTAFARVFVGVHYPLDVIGGAVLGFLVSLGLFWIFRYGEPVLSAILRLARRLYLA